MATRYFLKVEQYEETLGLIPVQFPVDIDEFREMVCLTLVSCTKNLELRGDSIPLGYLKVEKPELVPVPQGTVW